MAQRTITITLDFDDDATDEHMGQVVADLTEALYIIQDAGNYNDECPGYDHLALLTVR